MQRIHTTYDLLEGHILTHMLRENGIEAWLFDADFVRQDWFKQIAYGGYRILVREDAVAEARSLLDQYDDAALVPAAERGEPCPNCGETTGVDDPQPRRNVFLAMIALSLVEGFVLLTWKPSPEAILFAFAVQLVLYATIPWLVMRYFKWRLHCGACGHRWREPRRHRFAELSRMADAGGDSIAQPFA